MTTHTSREDGGAVALGIIRTLLVDSAMTQTSWMMTNMPTGCERGCGGAFFPCGSPKKKFKKKTLDRRSNAAADREKERQRAAYAAAARILKAEEDARRRARYERERMRHANARDAYERHWVGLLGSKSKSADLGFGDIPWPVSARSPSISEITAEAISSFLFLRGDEGHDEAGRGRARKEELRGTILRFHPDKFEGRVIPRIKDEERAAVREGANAVTRAVTTMMVGKLGGG